MQFLEAEVAANFDITPTRFHVLKFAGYDYDWNGLNDWPIPKIDLLTSTWGSLNNIAKYLTHVVPTCTTDGKRFVLRAYLPNIYTFHGGYEIYLI